MEVVVEVVVEVVAWAGGLSHWIGVDGESQFVCSSVMNSKKWGRTLEGSWSMRD